MDRTSDRQEPAALSEKAWRSLCDMLTVGHCESLKAGVHGLVLTSVALCASYNSAAWLRRRERHLAINAVVYSMAIWWESRHVLHHLAACPRPVRPSLERGTDVREAA